MAKIYLAASWKHPGYHDVLRGLEDFGHEVYDFRDPEYCFTWDKLDPNWESWTKQEYVLALDKPEAVRGFKRDIEAISWCDILIMLGPCGNSGHLELGRASGLGKYTIIYYQDFRGPDLMVKVADKIVCTLGGLYEAINEWSNK